ncbi:putative phage tail assembly chaperone [Aliivibrio fischeri]|uniref:Phage protein n=1 Tax=Aliivibrio fischeri TaxID=668 RepID=A0A510UF97_ALIFS|nr:putative phage tail assembly chaperone [Aliivibrio fischeri]GEK13219.1 hypothetical protein AFI02nite_12550 [Aliivibrio fischeri]
MKTESNNKAMDLIKSLQGAKKVIIPIVINGVSVHKGMEFNVSIGDYNKFINSSQSAKISPTAAAKDLLMHTVIDADKEMLGEILKITGTLDNITMSVVDKVTPDMSSLLD